MKKLLAAILAPLLMSSLLLGLFRETAAGQAQKNPTTTRPLPPASYKLVAVKVTGSKRFSSAEVAAASGLPMGTIAQEDDFKKAARQLGESGAFSNISYHYSYTSEGTKLEFQVTDADKFVPARFTDFVWYSDEELQRKIHERIPLYNGELPATGRLTDQVSDVVQAMLVEKAIPGHVEYSRATGKDDQLVAIVYNVAGVSVRIRQVEFPGAGAAELPLLQTAAEKMIDREYSRAFMSSFVERAFLPVLHEHGYLKAACGQPEPKVIKPSAPEPDDAGGERTLVDVIFPVTPGIQYKLTGWDWSGNKELASNALQPLIHAKTGQVANTVQLEDDLRAVQELYGSVGHLAATIKVDAQFDETAATVTYHLAVDEGPVYRMGELEFRGIDNNLTARLRAAWKLRTGDVYDATYLNQFLPQARKLLPTSVDWEVSTHVTPLTRDKTVDVDLQYTAKAPR